MPTELQNEIAEKGNKAPRVTPADVEAEIVSEHYFTAADGACFQWLTTDHSSAEQRDAVQRIAERIRTSSHASISADITANSNGVVIPPLALLTFCVLVLRNGYTVVGTSACAAPENFRADVGRAVAREDAVEKVWPLLGFRLRDKLASTPSSHIERMRLELEELDGRISKLTAFLKTETFASLPGEERDRMVAQECAMRSYSAVLHQRYAAATPV
jgi:hypothetical protein